MRRVGLPEMLLGLTAVVLVGLHFVVEDDLTLRSAEVLPGMVTSPAFEAQDPNPNFADGTTLRRPAEGTIARGYPPYRVGRTLLDTTTPWRDLSADAKTAWAAHEAPWAGTALDKVTEALFLRHGESVFSNVCATCHVKGATGQTEVTKRGVPLPPSLLDQQAKDYADGHVFRHITCGIGEMPSHASQIERLDRWKVILYLRSLQTP